MHSRVNEMCMFFWVLSPGDSPACFVLVFHSFIGFSVDVGTVSTITLYMYPSCCDNIQDLLVQRHLLQ